MTIKLFITGTDTDVGKTYISTRLLKQFARHGLSTLGLKPLATGCTLQEQAWVNADALALQQAASIKLPYDQINPLAFEPAIAPHIAASLVDCPLSVALLTEKLQPALTHPADICLIEGVGGWYVPLNQTETMADFVAHLALPVIMVVDIKLGCLNHAILTANAITRDGAKLIGWIANTRNREQLVQYENVLSLQNWIKSPLLGFINNQADINFTISNQIFSTLTDPN